MQEILGLDPQIAEEMPVSHLDGFLGGAPWPKKGQELRPVLQEVPKPSISWRILPFSASVFAVLILLCRQSSLFVHKTGKQSAGEDVNDPEQAVSLGSNLTGGTTMSHLHALACAIVWRHLQWRTLLAHALRIAIPVFFVIKIDAIHDLISNSEMAKAQPLLKSQKAQLSAGILDFAVVTGVLYIVQLSMTCFSRHLRGESDSGLRHLLHVSGVSRPAYMLATVGIDGFCLVMVQLAIMLVAAVCWLQLRVVLWTSPILLIIAISLMIASSLLTGSLIHFLAPSARMADVIGQIVVAVALIQALMSLLRPVVPPLGEQSWSALALPVIPAYRAFFELAVGCMKGRCLTMADLSDAVRDGEFVGLWSMIIGREHPVELTPPGAFFSFVLLVAFQLKLGWVLVLLLDVRRHPSLHDSGAPGQKKTMDNSMLEVQGLTHQYGWFRGMLPSEKRRTLNGVTFTVAPGAVLGLLGPNGAGKTTCIRCITGEEAPTEGKIALDSRNDGSYIGLCPQETVLNESLTVKQNMLFFAYIRGCSGNLAERTLEHFLAVSCLSEKRDCLPATLSGGMKRRLAVACSLIGSPSVVVLDEPTTGLDPVSRRGIWSTIIDIKLGGGCCLMTTHMLEEAEALCSKLVVIKKGLVVASGSVQQLKEEWGTGYILNVDSKPGHQDAARHFVASRVPSECSAPIKTTEGGQMTFKLNIEEEALGHLIIAVARGKHLSGIRHWGISQASLEDTYLKIIDTESDSSVQS